MVEIRFELLHRGADRPSFSPVSNALLNSDCTLFPTQREWESSITQFLGDLWAQAEARNCPLQERKVSPKFYPDFRGPTLSHAEKNFKK